MRHSAPCTSSASGRRCTPRPLAAARNARPAGNVQRASCCGYLYAAELQDRGGALGRKKLERVGDLRVQAVRYRQGEYQEQYRQPRQPSHARPAQVQHEPSATRIMLTLQTYIVRYPRMAQGYHGQAQDHDRQAPQAHPPRRRKDFFPADIEQVQAEQRDQEAVAPVASPPDVAPARELPPVQPAQQPGQHKHLQQCDPREALANQGAALAAVTMSANEPAFLPPPYGPRTSPSCRVPGEPFYYR